MKLRNPRPWGVVAAMAVVTLALTASAGAVTSSVVCNAVPSPLPPNVASVGFEATSTSEFGDYVHLGGTDRNLNAVTVTMSDWALHSDYPSMLAAGWTHPITLNIYNVVPGTPNALGSRLGTVTQTISIPWRPEASPGCGTAWIASDGQCYNGIAFNATFDMSPEPDAAERCHRRNCLQHRRLRLLADPRRRAVQLAQRRRAREPTRHGWQ
jgi:hypothetical protein